MVARDDMTSYLAIPSLRSLELFGPPTDRMRAFIAYLRVPHLNSLDLHLRDQVDSLPIQTPLLRAVAGASFAQFLSRLALVVQTKPSPHAHVDQGVAPPTVMSFISALFSLPGLRVLSVMCYSDNAMLGMDADMLAVATAWRNLEDLIFDFPFSEMYDVGGFPGMPALAHFAAHCPRLVRLRILLALRRPPDIPDSQFQDAREGPAGEPLPAQVSSASHSLRTLEVQIRQWDSGVEPEAVARRIDELFPNLGRDELRFRYTIRPRMPPRRYKGRWYCMISAWKESRAARGGDVYDT